METETVNQGEEASIESRGSNTTDEWSHCSISMSSGTTSAVQDKDDAVDNDSVSWEVIVNDEDASITKHKSEENSTAPDGGGDSTDSTKDSDAGPKTISNTSERGHGRAEFSSCSPPTSNKSRQIVETVSRGDENVEKSTVAMSLMTLNGKSDGQEVKNVTANLGDLTITNNQAPDSNSESGDHKNRSNHDKKTGQRRSKRTAETDLNDIRRKKSGSTILTIDISRDVAAIEASLTDERPFFHQKVMSDLSSAKSYAAKGDKKMMLWSIQQAKQNAAKIGQDISRDEEAIEGGLNDV